MYVLEENEKIFSVFESEMRRKYKNKDQSRWPYGTTGDTQIIEPFKFYVMK